MGKHDTKVAGKVRLRPRDEVRLSPDALLRFEPAGTPTGLMARRNLLITVLVVLVLGGVAIAVFNPFAPKTEHPDWDRTHNILQAWVTGEVKSGHLPQALSRLISDWLAAASGAWRCAGAHCNNGGCCACCL